MLSLLLKSGGDKAIVLFDHLVQEEVVTNGIHVVHNGHIPIDPAIGLLSR
jgi:hypothetical protein